MRQPNACWEVTDDYNSLSDISPFPTTFGSLDVTEVSLALKKKKMKPRC